MKHQYESEILFHLMERDGFNIPSSVPPYESEIKAYLINQVKLAYPKLTDYEAEWLLYNYTKHLPADFPISSATNVTKATFENVVPFAYQSAILKGQTLVNLNTNTNVSQNLSVSATRSYPLNIPYNIVANKQFTLKLNIKDSTVTQQVMLKTIHIDDTLTYDVLKNGNEIGFINRVFTKAKDVKNIEIYLQATETGNVTVENIVMLEGDYTNVNIPYFTGMSSVKTPVLTVTGKNLFDISKVSNFNVNDDKIIIHKTDADKELISVSIINPNQPISITLNYNITEPNGSWTPNIVVNYTDGSKIEKYIHQLPLITSDDKIIKSIYIRNPWSVGVALYDVQIEQGTVATTYEPFKANILTVNEDVTLRSNGNICDELNLLTGQLTQRIDEDGEVLSQEGIKTVDLKTINESGESVHFMPLEGTMNVQSSGEIIQPTFDMSVPVEATTQNLASFIDLEMEE